MNDEFWTNPILNRDTFRRKEKEKITSVINIDKILEVVISSLLQHLTSIKTDKLLCSISLKIS